jgi:hypothetical protein
VAVIQISRIQQRRGQKPATGIPQLSSAELAWAVDTQELFIGNGSVAEGAPYVGNTRILTEHSNIFEDAVYQFMATDPEITSSVPRKAQSKLDEYVSVLDFIEKDGNGNISWADTFEAAINDLCSADHKYRKVITIPNGTYTFNRNWSLQNGVILRGETRDNVVLELGNYIVTTGLSTDIKLQNFTISGNATLFDIAGLTNSSFSDVTFKGTYSPDLQGNWYIPAIGWVNTTGYKVDNVKFTNCKFDTVNTCVLVVQRDSFETNVKFESCDFSYCYRGIAIKGVVGQSNRWIVSNCSFSDIYESAVVVSRGKNMLIRNSSFYRCGNGIGAASSPQYIIILFGDVDNNLVVNCSGDRRKAVGSSGLNTATEAVPDSENSSNSTFVDYIPVGISNNASSTAFALFSSTTDYILLEYGITIGDYTRYGKVNITLGDLTASPAGMTVTDTYFHAIPEYNSVDTDPTQQVEINASLTSTKRTVVLTYTNGSNNAGELVYRVTHGSVKAVVIPMQFEATGGNHQIFINWNPNAAPNGSPVTGFSLIIAQ